MECKEGLLSLSLHEKRRPPQTQKPHKWKISFHRSPPQPLIPPKEFLCPLSGSLMTDPVIVPSGHTFQRAFVNACKNLNYTPTLPDGVVPDLSTLIPNLALKTTILNWYSNNKNSIQITFLPLDISSAEKLVFDVMEREELICRVAEIPPLKLDHAVTELTRRPPTHFPSPSDESLGSTESAPPLQLATRPSCFSLASTSSSSSDSEEPLDEEEEDLLKKLKSPQVHVAEEALVTLRKTTKNNQEKRAHLCSTKLLSVLNSLLVSSRYVNVQVNAVACLVNLSLEKVNKVKIVRSGIVPFLIDVMKCGSQEAQEHACGAIFSLALEDFNKTAIGVLGSLPPLIHLLRSSKNELTRNDSALALYHLSFVRSNSSKLIKLGAIPVLLGLVGPDPVAGRVLLVLGNLASCSDGRAAILDSGGVARLVGVLSKDELGSESTREACVSVLYGLSYGELRFRGLAKAVGAFEEVLGRVENCGSERCRAMVRRILEVMKGRVVKEVEEVEAVDWEDLLDSRSFNRTRCRLGDGKGESNVKSSEF